MSSVNELNKIKTSDPNDIPTSRYLTTSRKRPTSIATDKVSGTQGDRKKRKMYHHSTPSNMRRNGDDVVNNDPGLISPILGENNGFRIQLDTNPDSSLIDSSGGSLAPTRARTNISDDLWEMRLRSLGERNNDSSVELAIAFLCLEDAASRRGIIQPRANRRMEWLDLEGLNIS